MQIIIFALPKANKICVSQHNSPLLYFYAIFFFLKLARFEFDIPKAFKFLGIVQHEVGCKYNWRKKMIIHRRCWGNWWKSTQQFLIKLDILQGRDQDSAEGRGRGLGVHPCFMHTARDHSPRGLNINHGRNFEEGCAPPHHPLVPPLFWLHRQRDWHSSRLDLKKRWFFRVITD